MLKIFKNKRKLKYIILSILIITVLLLSTIILTIVNNLSRYSNDTVQIAKATEAYSYSNPYIPKGFTHSEGSWNTGYVIKETATGNEFVWVPVYSSNTSSNTLARREFTKTFSSITQSTASASSTDTLENSFNTSVNKYGGYYVGRYEAGVGATSGNTAGVPVCKQGVNVWRNISRNNAVASAQKMYQSNEELISSLMSSYAYDTMLNWIKSNNYNVDNDSSAWGNYKNSSNGSIQVAGNNTRWKANNIYDVAGNVWEWTTENYGNDAVVRGGDALSNGNILPAGTRDHASPTSAFDYTGFRVLLYRDVNYIEKATALAIAAGANHTAYIDSNNTLWMWGKNTNGELGNGNTNSPITKPTAINTTVKFKEVVLRSAYAQDSNLGGYTEAIDTSGYLYGWGDNAYGYIGDNHTSSSSQKISTPKKISDTKFQKISAGYSHSLAIDTSGNIWAWGSNASYKTGLNKNTGYTGVPTQITSGTQFKEISAGYSHSMALDQSGNLYTWGGGDSYKLCTGNKTSVKTPTKVNTGTTFTKISAGYKCSFAIDKDGQLWGCGGQDYGQLGNRVSSTTSYVQSFTKNITNTGKTFKDISNMAYTTIAMDKDGNLWGWGYNDHGQLGNGEGGSTTTKSTSPIQILAGIKIKKIAMGVRFFIAVAENEDVYTCGCNRQGKLGNGLVTPTNSYSNDAKVPIKITISQ